MQLRILQKQLIYLNDKSPYYKELFAENNIDISKIKTIEDLQYLPFTEKKELQIFVYDTRQNSVSPFYVNVK